MQGLFLSQKTTKFSAAFLLATALAVLAGCSPGTTPSSSAAPPPAAGTAAKIQLSVSLPQILSTSTSTSDLTAIVLDSTGHAIAGKVVTFSTGGDTTAYFTSTSATSATTDANGVATATLNIGSNMTNRTITVSATADAAVGTTTVKIVGTTITISGNTSLSLNASTALTVSVKNSAGVAVPSVTLTVASQNGNGIVKAPATGITDANGQLVITVTATSATTPDTITVTGAGATQTQALTITATSSSFAFTAPITIVPPATTPEIVVNTPTLVSILWTVAGTPQTGKLVNFYTTRGTITASATTDGTGTATVSLSAASTGATILTAAGPGNTPTASLNVVFVTNTASTITAQASPGTIGVNVAGTTTNQSVISVVIRDAALNLVKNANVGFNLAADPSSGSLSAPTAVTDISGTASVNYIAGASCSGVNQEQITATVDSIKGLAITPISTSTTLTVAGQTYFVRLETDNTVLGGGTTFSQYTKNYYALVTDAAGHAVANTIVYFTLRPTTPPAVSFAKGIYTVVGTSWAQSVKGSCASEDLNSNGILDVISVGPPLVTEDTNGNGQLDPYGVAVVNATATTDATGYATASITYNKNYAYWVQLVLEARTMVTGNDPPALVTVLLPGVAADYTDINIAPPGESSPFGVGSSCADTK
jgi:hypothetical protein